MYKNNRNLGTTTLDTVDMDTQEPLPENRTRRKVSKIIFLTLLFFAMFYITPLGNYPRYYISSLGLKYDSEVLCAISFSNTQICRDKVRLSKGIKTGQTFYCRGVYDERQCIQNIAVARGEEEICDFQFVPNPIICKESVRIPKAVESRDIQMCKDLTYPEVQSKCYAQIGIALNDARLCEMTENHFIRGDCLAKIALQTKDYAYCEKMATTSNKIWEEFDNRERNNCIVGVALQEADMSGCNKIKNNSFLQYEVCLDGIKRGIRSLD